MLLKLFSALLILLLMLAAVALLTHQKLPDNSHRSPSQSQAPQDDSPLVQHLQAQLAQHPQQSGIYPLRGGRDAFLARLALAENAKHTLDVQYYSQYALFLIRRWLALPYYPYCLRLAALYEK